MAKHKITKTVDKNLKHLAEQLDEMFGPEFDALPTRQAIHITLAEARTMNLPLPENLPEDADEKGMMLFNRVQYSRTPVNRYRRMRTAYEKGGNDAVNAWLGPYTKQPGYEVQRMALAKRLAAADQTRSTVPDKAPEKKGLFRRFVDKVRDLSLPNEL